MQNKLVHKVTFLLLVVGGLNWLLVGAMQYDLVMSLLGAGAAANAVYILVGLSAVWQAITYFKQCGGCDSGSSMSSGMGM